MNTGFVLKQLFAAFPNSQVSAETVAVYMRLLQDIPLDALQVAVDQAIATCKFLPTVAELRDSLHGLRNVQRLSWGEAWDDVQKEVRRIGFYGVPHFNSEITASVVRSMGWRTICTSENPQTDRAQFRDMYTAMLQRQDFTQKLLPQALSWSAKNSGGVVPLAQLVNTAALEVRSRGAA